MSIAAFLRSGAGRSPLSARLAAAVALAIAALSFALALPAPVAHAAPVDITAGTLRWGVKASWRQYAHDGAQSGGVTQGPGGVYEFPIESGSYDPDTRVTTIQAKGTIHWQSHWYPNEALLYPPPVGYTGPLDIHVLDVTLRDPELTIGAQGSVLTVEAISRNVLTWELVDLGRVSIVELDPSAIVPAVAGGVTSWDGIPTALTESGARGVFGGNYSIGTAVDPVAFSYTGPGGAPDFSEHWTAPDSNGLTLAANGTFGFFSAVQAIWADPARGIVHDWWQDNTTTTVQAWDVQAGAHVGTPLVLPNLDFGKLLGPIVDPAGNTVYSSSQNNATIDSKLHWNADTQAYEQGPIPPFDIVADGRQLWDAEHERGLDVVRVVPGGADPTDYEAHEWYVVAYTRQPDESFVERRYRLPNAPTGWNEGWYNRTMNAAALAADGSIVLPRGVPITSQPGVTPAVVEQVGVQRLVLHDDTDTATVSELPGTQEPLAEVNALNGYDAALANESGDVAAVRTGFFPSKLTRIRQYELGAGGMIAADGGLVELSQSRSVSFAIDPVDGTVWHDDNRGQRLNGVRGGRLVYSRTSPLINTRGLAIGTLDDRSVWIQSSDGTPATFAGSTFGFARFTPNGHSPVVTDQPDGASATVAAGGGRAVSFIAAATGTPTPTVRWQRRAPGSAKFVDVAGATAATLAFDATAADNGAAYRAVFANAAGQLASEPATLEVRYAPSVSFQPADESTTEGADATFDLLVTGSPAPQIVWQRQVGGFWQAVDGDSGDFVVDGNRLTVTDANAGMSGARFRARVANAVGVVHSRAATLTVATAVTGPVTFGSGSVDWGFANRWRCYVVGMIAHGGIDLAGGVERIPGTPASGSLCPGAGIGSEALRFPVRGGSFDPSTGALTVDLKGTVRFWGHVQGGTPALDTTFAKLRIVSDGTTATLLADATGATLQDPTPVTRAGVALASIDLAGVRPVPTGDGLAWSAAPTALTADGVPVFGSYPAGEPFDPLSMRLVFGTPQTDPQPQPVPDPLPSPQPQPQPKPQPHVKVPAARFAVATKPLTLSAGRVATLATLTCAAERSCTVTAPERVVVTIAGSRYRAGVIVPKTIRAGKRAALKIKLTRRAAARLQGRRTTVGVAVKVVGDDGVVTPRTVRVTLKRAKARAVVKR